jgi:very-short-patch-repair endonuclease
VFFEKMVKTVEMTCANCGELFERAARFAGEDRNYFCGSACSATYNNKQREVGHTRSKLELWIEPRLKEDYPNLDIHFNRKDAINHELDIYVPELKLAIEINGRFHYEVVYSQSLLEATQRNDAEKAQKCKEAGIELVTIDASSLKYLTHKKGYRYLNMIHEIIDAHL